MPKIRSPADYCREDWHCLVCGTPKEKLARWLTYNPGQVRCKTCGCGYYLTVPPEGSKKRYVPKPIQNKRWRDIWYRAWLHYKDPGATRAFMNQFIFSSEANNAMNRLDGGGMIARERASREAETKIGGSH